MFLRKIALVQCLYLLAVIVYGALVRATRSGAGCGAHWPLCNGELVPEIAHYTTAIELGHRLTSGLCLPLALWVLYLAFKQRARLPWAYRFAWGTVLLVIIEALIGAALVLLEHVAYNTSGYRALSISVHLLSSNFLLACALLTWEFSRAGKYHLQRVTPKKWQLVVAGIAILSTNFSGAFTVLADTLFPSASVANSFAESMTEGKHLFVRMRVFHPFFAMLNAALVLFLLDKTVKLRSELDIFRQAILALFLCQALLGLSNILWPAAVALQLSHLLGAELIWLCYVLLSSRALRSHPNSPK
jgi:heme A synthase